MHVLNWCKISLDEGRFTWNHDYVLKHMLQQMFQAKTHSPTLYADMKGFKINHSTIPADIISTAVRPDLVIVNRNEKRIELLELTCSFESNAESAHQLKFRKYLDLQEDLQNMGWSVQLLPFEIGSRGHISKRNKDSINQCLKRNQMKVNNNKLFKDLSKISLLCSFVIFQAHCQPAWQAPPLLHP